MTNVLFFDLETQKIFEDVGGRHNVRKLGLSVGVTYSTADQDYHVYTEADADALVQDLSQADLVIGFNVLRFDYEVLRAYSNYPFTQIPTVDMLDHIYRTLGFRVSLDALASATFCLSPPLRLTVERSNRAPIPRDSTIGPISPAACFFDRPATSSAKVTFRRTLRWGMRHESWGT